LPWGRPGAADLALVVVTCSLAFANARIFSTAQIDDAYITFRYADNLARGLGPVYSAYERVEGSSSLLSVVVLAAFVRLGVEALTAARFVGTAAFVGLTALTYFTVRFEARCFPRILAAGAALVVAASTPLAFYAMSGLETDLYAFVLTLTFALLVVLPFRSAVAVAVAGGLVAMARPEGPLFFGLLFAFLLLKVRRAGPMGLRDVLRAAGAFVVPLGALTLFRLGYYHSWIPNTVRAKDGSSARFHGMGVAEIWGSLAHSEGAAMIASYGRHLGVTAIVAIAGLCLRRTRFATAAALTVVACCALLVVWSDGDWMGRERLMTPAVAPAAIAMALGLDALREAFPRVRRSVLVALTSAALVFGPAAWGGFYEHAYQFPFERTARYLRELGTSLRGEARDGDLLATDIGGRVPYYSRLPTIETFGLCDAYIAAHGRPWPRMGKTDPAYVIARDPTFYLFNLPGGARDLFLDPAFAARRDDYLVVQTPEYMNGFGKMLLVRRDRPALDHLAATLNAHLVDFSSELQRLRLLR
jgi:hypothetical protein